jgi:hypothetical protein
MNYPSILYNFYIFHLFSNYSLATGDALKAYYSCALHVSERSGPLTGRKYIKDMLIFGLIISTGTLLDSVHRFTSTII